MISPAQVKATIESKLPDAQVQVYSSDGEHFEVTVVSSLFEGKRLVQQHQLVYGALQEALSTNAMHAVALKTYTPQSWETAGQPI